MDVHVFWSKASGEGMAIERFTVTHDDEGNLYSNLRVMIDQCPGFNGEYVVGIFKPEVEYSPDATTSGWILIEQIFPVSRSDYKELLDLLDFHVDAILVDGYPFFQSSRS